MLGPLSQIWLEMHGDLWLCVTLNAKVTRIYLDRNKLMSVRDDTGQTLYCLNIILLYVLCRRRSLFRLSSVTSSILCYVTGSNPECWTVTKDIYGVGGVAHNFTSLDQCTEKCINDSSCVAIDWQPSFAGKTCWILTLRYTREAVRRGVFTHYAYKQSCRR